MTTEAADAGDRRAALERMAHEAEASVAVTGADWEGWQDRRIADPVERARAWYLRGSCSVFAAVLWERTGWPIVGFHAATDGPGRWSPRHWACLDPDGGYADARGRGLSLADMETAYGAGLVPVEADMAEVVSRFVRPVGNYEAARAHLETLLPGLPDAEAEAAPAFFPGR